MEENNPVKPSSSASSSSSSVGSSVRRLRCLEPATHLVNDGMEKIFFRLGYFIGRHPWTIIALAFTLCVTLGFGLLFWTEEHDDVALWTTTDSPVRFNSEWVKQHFSDDVRYESVIVAADQNVLRPQVLTLLAEMDQSVRNLTTADGHRWSDLCARFGNSLKKDSKRRRRRQDDFQYDLSGLDFSQVFEGGEEDVYGELAGSSAGAGSFLGRRAGHLINLLSQPDNCLMRNILQIWDSDLERIRSLDERQILEDVNAALLKGQNQSDVDSLEFLLSDVRRDSNGTVYHVGATMMIYLIDKNQLNASIHEQWEKDFIQETLHSNLSMPDDVHFYSLASHSYDEGLAETLTSNLTVLMAGFSLIIFYFSFAMGRFNWIEQRLVLSILGVSVVGQAIMASYGLCFYLGVFYGPVHPIIPFLMLGIGVDDMFVIIQALDNLSAEEKLMPIPERMARALKYAGVSITVTSVTDIAAFAIGATTSMPALRSFCINAMAGILMLFILEVTFFVALTVLDERRKASRQACCFFRPKPDNWKPPSCSQREMLKVFFERFYGPFLLRTPVKVAILLLTATAVAVNVWGILNLEQNFDPSMYLKEHSYPSEYFGAMKHYFPESGERASIYTGRIDYLGQREQLNHMTDLLRSNPFIHPNSVSFWYDDFQVWLNQTRLVEFPEDEAAFKELVQEYLFSPEGRHHLQDIRVEGSILDLEGNFTITGSRARFHHLSLKNSTAKNTALRSITSMSESIYFGPEADPPSPIIYTYIYVEWEANRVISNELIRNLGLTMAAVVSVTLILISDLVTVFWVFTCIAFTLIDLLGLMYYWGLTVEISSSIIVILAAGLAIDYSAHIGHTFTTVRGSKSTRAKVTLTRMGPAVWNGGFSTFLAFVLLVNTDSHIFTTFFKLFFGVVVFGLFHGLAYLPVVLSCFGPAEIAGSGTSGSIDSISTEFSSATSASSSASTPVQKSKKHQQSAASALENPIFICSDIQIVCYPEPYNPLDRMSNYNQSNLQRSSSKWQQKSGSSRSNPSFQAEGEPYIPQPDYTPAPTRRSESFRVQPTSSKTRPTSLMPVQPLPRLDEKRLSVIQRPVSSLLNGPVLLPPVEELSPTGASATSPGSGDRVWHHPQWYNSSQFQAQDWNAALMKRLSVEAQTLREEKIRRQADSELDRFESEIGSYLEDEEEEEEDDKRKKKTTSSGTSTPKSSSTLTASPPLSSSPAGAGAVSPGRTGRHAQQSGSGGRAQRGIAYP